MDHSQSQPPVPSFESLLDLAKSIQKPGTNLPAPSTSSAFEVVGQTAGDEPVKKRKTQPKRVPVKKVKRVAEVVLKDLGAAPESGSLPLMSLASVGVVAEHFGTGEEVSDDRSLVKGKGVEVTRPIATSPEVVRVSSEDEESVDALPLSLSLRRFQSGGLSTIGEERADLRISDGQAKAFSVEHLAGGEGETTVASENEGEREVIVPTTSGVVPTTQEVLTPAIEKVLSVTPDTSVIVPTIDIGFPAVPVITIISGEGVGEMAPTTNPDVVIPFRDDGSVNPSMGGNTTEREAVVGTSSEVPPSCDIPQAAEVPPIVEELQSRIRVLEQSLANMAIAHTAFFSASPNAMSGSVTDIVNFRMGARYTYDVMVRRGVVTQEAMAADPVTSGLLWWFYA